MPDIQETQAVLQTLAGATGSFQTTQACLIFLCSETNAPEIFLGASQVSLEVLMPDTLTRTSQTALEVLMPDTAVQTSQFTVEFMVPDTGFSHLAYVMRAVDTTGNQWVYWEADDPSLAPSQTIPVAVGALTDTRIFFAF